MVQRERLSQADFVDFVIQLSADDPQQYELIDGDIVAMPPSSGKPTTTAMRIGYYLTDYLIRHDEPGYLTSADGAFELDASTTLVPDVGYISKARQPELPERFFPQPPDLAIEVVSPTDRVKAVQQKALKYLRAGTRLVWIVYPLERVVDVCHLADDGGLHILEVGLRGTLDGEDILPGLTLPVASLFPA